MEGLTRHFTLAEFGGSGPIWEIGTDASPWGMGGCPITEEDLQIFGLTRGSCEGQQTLEGLAILVAMRLWSHRDNPRQVKLRVKGDRQRGCAHAAHKDETVVA